MDTKKIGAFLKQCRKEKNLTQEQLAEKFEVSARTVSRWETGINMPDLSILVQLAEYYDVEMRELLDGERSQTMNKEMKETLDKVAVYEGWVKQKALKAGNLAFASMFVISVLAIIIQMLLTVDIRLVLGETATALVGGILYASIMVYNGIWDKCLPKSATIWRDFLTSVICAGIFTVIYGICLFRMGATETQITRLALGFLIGIIIGILIATVRVVPKYKMLPRILNGFCSFYVGLFRGTPMVVQLLVCYYVLLPIIGVKLTGVQVSVLVFGLNSGAYISEMMRAGILSVDGGQMEAGRAMGLSFATTMRKIVIPQAVKNILPTLGNEFIALIKETSVVSFVGAADLYVAFNYIGSNSYEFMVPYLVMAVIYIALVLLISLGIKCMERSLRKSDRRN